MERLGSNSYILELEKDVSLEELIEKFRDTPGKKKVGRAERLKYEDTEYGFGLNVWTGGSVIVRESGEQELYWEDREEIWDYLEEITATELSFLD